MQTPENSISIALTVSNTIKLLGISEDDPTELGGFLFKRRVMGARVVANSKKEIGGLIFSNYGSHAEDYPELPYITVACAIGSEKRDIDVFLNKLESNFVKSSKKDVKIDQVKSENIEVVEEQSKASDVQENPKL